MTVRIRGLERPSWEWNFEFEIINFAISEYNVDKH